MLRWVSSSWEEVIFDEIMINKTQKIKIDETHLPNPKKNKQTNNSEEILCK